MTNAQKTLLAIIVMSALGLFVVLYNVFTYEAPIEEPKDDGIEKWCVVKTASFGESLILTGDQYGEYNVMVTPSGAIIVTSPCPKEE